MSPSRRSEPSASSFTYRGRRIGYGDHGSGPRAIVLIHGLLMDSRMYTRLAPARLDRELLAFLDEVWRPQRAAA